MSVDREERPPLGTKKSLLGVPNNREPQVIMETDGTGYNKHEFAQKSEQMEEVMDHLEKSGFIPQDLVEGETKWFYEQLGIDDLYFAKETASNISSYVLALYAAKVSAYTRDDHKLILQVRQDREDHAVYIDTYSPNSDAHKVPQYETIIDDKYLSPSDATNAWRLETFWSDSEETITGDYQQMRCYFAYKCQFSEPNLPLEVTDINRVSDRAFLERATDYTKNLYQKLICQVSTRMGPCMEVFEVENTRTWRLVVGYRQGNVNNYFSALTSLYRYYGLTSTRKYVEQFSNGITILSVYLVQAPLVLENGVPKKRHPPIEHSIHQIVKEASLLFCLPVPVFAKELEAGRISLQEAVYAHCGFIFVSHFLNRLGAEFDSLMNIIDVSISSNMELMERLKRRLRGETFTREYIADIIRHRSELLPDLYLHFANKHYVQNTGNDNFIPTLSFQRIQVSEVLSTEDLKDRIKRTTSDEHEMIVLLAFIRFNEHILKTNFYTPTKVALSFRLDPSFLLASEYPQPLYGMLLVVGQEFRGFHLRFRDVARGGIRIVKSRNREAYSINARSLFDENYNLANTQQRKNKDIPEGGSKGVILLDMEHQDHATQAFQKYIDSIIDILIPGQSPGIKEAIVDLHGQSEILFMGPDENTAGLVNWATLHAKARSAPWWKSFFTGKSPSYGGIPHDHYGMTSLSVREYVKGIYRKMKLDNTKTYKLQTGGPDGDLGSNEILLSTDNEVYVAIVDGSGVIADPNGLDKNELRRLAKARQMIVHYDDKLLSKEGYRVLVDDKDVTLPNGTFVNNGTSFRNIYHLEAAKLHKIDIFVPCGGRPEAINTANVHNLIDPNTGKTLIPYIVEGANLFISQTAKLELEKAGAVLYKDASANKGGVTSSSMEVLASLAFDDEGFFKDMCVDDTGATPAFYTEYVKGVQARIQENARLEFEAIWADHQKTQIARSILSDKLSNDINEMSDDLSSSALWDDVEFRNGILMESLPNQLLDRIGLDTILERVPDAYLRAIFGSYLAGRYIYSHGTDQNQFAFYEYMVTMRNKIVNKRN